MTTIISTTKIPCRAKDPHTCKYHGAELRAEAALKAGKINEYLVAQAEMTAAIKTTPEILEFFAAQVPAGEQVKTQPVADDAGEKLGRGLTAHLAAAEQSLEERMTGARLDSAFPYTAGGTASDIAQAPLTVPRSIYHNMGMRLLDSEKLDGTIAETDLRDILAVARDSDTRVEAFIEADPHLAKQIAATHDHLQERLLAQYASPIAPGGHVNQVPTARLLRQLDLAYWQAPNVGDEAAINFQKADDSRKERLNDHRRGKPYLVGGTLQDVEDTEFTAARLVYQRTANELLNNVSPSLSTEEGSSTVNWYTFDRAYQSTADRMMDELATDDLQPAEDIEETRRTLDQVHRVLESRATKRPGEIDKMNLNLNRALRTLDLAFWNSPNGPAATR